MQPRRTERVLIATSRRVVEIPWASRDKLLGEIRHLDSGRDVIAAFNAVGTSRPVELETDGKQLLVHAINLWSENVDADGLPDGVWDLRNVLVDDLHDTAGGP